MRTGAPGSLVTLHGMVFVFIQPAVPLPAVGKHQPLGTLGSLKASPSLPSRSVSGDRAQERRWRWHVGPTRRRARGPSVPGASVARLCTTAMRVVRAPQRGAGPPRERRRGPGRAEAAPCSPAAGRGRACVLRTLVHTRSHTHTPWFTYLASTVSAFPPSVTPKLPHSVSWSRGNEVHRPGAFG